MREDSVEVDLHGLRQGSIRARLRRRREGGEPNVMMLGLSRHPPPAPPANLKQVREAQDHLISLAVRVLKG